MNETLIIIATYDEADNIEFLIENIFHNRSDVDILVVDDNSPDGTAKRVENLQKTYPAISLIERCGKLGYGSACLEGFRWALKYENYKYFITMDADLSHNPKYIHALLKKIKEKSVVIGSRYVEGGSVKNWGIHRKILSRGANLYSRCILNISVSDCTSGFRCYRREVIENIDFGAIRSDGYSFLAEILYACKLHNASIWEVPFVFENRKAGKSKLNRNEIFKAIVKVPQLRFTLKNYNRLTT